VIRKQGFAPFGDVLVMMSVNANRAASMGSALKTPRANRPRTAAWVTYALREGV
jgi:hypothetical protein